MKDRKVRFIRYPGGKQRILNYIIPYLPTRELIEGKFVEPFVGSGAVFFALNPRASLLSDINRELIDLYRGIRRYPLQVWEVFKSFPKTKKAYYEIRSANLDKMDLAYRAARTLYLNRTCFKGMWRHNSIGEFNVGYGGQDRRWVISQEDLIKVSGKLKRTSLKYSDFQKIIDSCVGEDFIFVDPPYRPGEREMMHNHYVYCKFSYDDHKRLALALKRASHRGIRWALTTSSHPDILHLFRGNYIHPLAKGTGKRPGILTDNTEEVLIRNYEEVPQ
jgi:DNA adenine methylase